MHDRVNEIFVWFPDIISGVGVDEMKTRKGFVLLRILSYKIQSETIEKIS